MIDNSPQKILLVQLFSNGDCLYATAVARQIKSDFPQAHLTWAIASFCASIIANNPYVDQVLVVDDVPRNDVAAFRKKKKQFLREQKNGKWDRVFVTTNMDNNQRLYDGTIRGMILGAYPFPIKVPVEPVVVLSESEKRNVADFAARHNLSSFRHVILWEYAPQSGQAGFTFDLVWDVASRITADPGVCIILSSAKSFESSGNIIDGSVLTVRENAALTHYCNFMIGCSSGLTWLNTSSAAAFVPMVQLLDGYTPFFNPPSRDFQRYGLPVEKLIELTTITAVRITRCVQLIISSGFEAARNQYNEELPVQFNTTRKVVYNMMCYLQFNAVRSHYDLMKQKFGAHPELKKQYFLAIATFPFKLLNNIVRKKLSKN